MKNGFNPFTAGDPRGGIKRIDFKHAVLRHFPTDSRPGTQ